MGRGCGGRRQMGWVDSREGMLGMRGEVDGGGGGRWRVALRQAGGGRRKIRDDCLAAKG